MRSDLRTEVREAFRCYLCGGTRAVPLVVVPVVPGDDPPSALSASTYACTSRESTSPLRVVACTTCGLRALHPAPDPAGVEEAYVAVEDPSYVAIERHRGVAFQKLVARVNRWRPPPGRLLDVGTYTGLFVASALRSGWDAYGLEPSAWAVRRAEERVAGRVRPGFLRDRQFAPQSFDIVTLWDVLEHLADPRAELRLIRDLLRPRGLLFLSTMASDAFIARLLGPRWPWYLEMHRFYFTAETLEAILQQAGFRLRAVEPYPHYTSLRYIAWKLEARLGGVARSLGHLASLLGLADRTLKVDLKDFFLVVAEPAGGDQPRRVP